MKIYLSDIPQEGEEFKFTRESGELNEVLKDVLGKRSYEVNFRIQPIGNAYELQGKFKADMDLICSRCALDFIGQISESFKEILVIVDKDRPRNSKMAKGHGGGDLYLDDPYCQELDSDLFNVGEFVREIIALAEPLNPTGKANCDETCENYQRALREGWLNKPSENPSESPFAVLAQLKH